jgi:hypothetical protein
MKEIYIIRIIELLCTGYQFRRQYAFLLLYLS